MFDCFHCFACLKTQWFAIAFLCGIFTRAMTNSISYLHISLSYLFDFRSAQQAQNNAAQAGLHASIGIGPTETKLGQLEVPDLSTNHNYDDGQDYATQEYTFAGYWDAVWRQIERPIEAALKLLSCFCFLLICSCVIRYPRTKNIFFVLYYYFSDNYREQNP